MATYNDYPQSASNNAKKVLEWKKKYGKEVKGMTAVGCLLYTSDAADE